VLLAFNQKELHKPTTVSLGADFIKISTPVKILAEIYQAHTTHIPTHLGVRILLTVRSGKEEEEQQQRQEQQQQQQQTEEEPHGDEETLMPNSKVPDLAVFVFVAEERSHTQGPKLQYGGNDLDSRFF
jgi:hypothetical protein